MGTIVIVDLAHHGTTMVSGLCCILGVPMLGSRYDEEKLEDLDIEKAMLTHKRDVFDRIVEKRNDAHSSWGFKRVGGWIWAEWFEKLRDPVYLAIYKDPVTVTRRRFGNAAVNGILNTVVQMERSMQGIRNSGLRVHFLSYQTAVVRPEKFVRGIAYWAGVDVSEEQMQKALGYIQPNIGDPRGRYPRLGPWI